MIKDIQSKIQNNNLYAKFYLFNEENLFNMNIHEINPDKLKILSLLKDELLSIKRKFNTNNEKNNAINEKINTIDEKIDRKFNLILQMIAIIFNAFIVCFIILISKKTIKL